VKQLNRQGEHRLFEAEVFSAIASLDGYDYPMIELETSWKTLLLNQFHDILPGSSINEVYVDSHRQMEEVVEMGECLRDRVLALGNRPGSSKPKLIVANAGIAPRPLTVLIPNVVGEQSIDVLQGAPDLTQPVENGTLISIPGVDVPGLGSVALAHGSDAAEPSMGLKAVTSDAGFSLENDLVRVLIGADGTIHSLFDNEAQREAFADRGNQLWTYVDKPYSWDAWDLDETYAREGEEVAGIQSLGIVESGPVRASVRVERQWRGSTIAQTYRLWLDSKRLDIETEIDWHERQVLLKTHMPLAVRSHQAAFETMYGAVYRPTHRNSPWDAARFEGCGHRWGDLSEAGYGVAILNDAKYGYEALGSDLMVSLLRSPLYPDPLADEGKHHFTYSVFPHIGDWSESNVVDEAFALNSPLIVAAGAPRDGFLRVEGLSLGIGALKRAEDGDGLILRIYEPNGARGTAKLAFARWFSITAVDLLEDQITEPAGVQIDDDTHLTLDFRPFEVKSIRLAAR
jgi:alpha-mannosidase